MNVHELAILNSGAFIHADISYTTAYMEWLIITMKKFICNNLNPGVENQRDQ